MGIYDFVMGKVKIYVNGEFCNMIIGGGFLFRDWLLCVGIGDYKVVCFFMGFIDEFRIYNYVLFKVDIEVLVKMCFLGMLFLI